MYELVLMMALSNSPAMAGAQPESDTPVVKTYGLRGHREYRHRRGGCHGGGGGGCSGGYGGYGCMSSYGGYGGCTGSYGGYGGCTGGYGGYGGCTGGYGGYGGCTGGYGGMGGYAGYGCAGGGYAMYGGSMGGYAGFIDYSGMGGYAGYSPIAPVEYSASYGPTFAAPATPSNPGMTNTQRGDEATLVVDLPANARLTIDGQPTRLTSATRTFVTPSLKPGQEYFYDLKAELNRDGKTLTATKRVTVQPGQESHIRLDFAAQTATSED